MAPPKQSRSLATTKGKTSTTPKPATRKRNADDNEDNTTITPPSVKKRRSTAKERSAADPHNPSNKLVDSLRPGLILVLIGLNPGLMTAEKGWAYAHPSNLYWKLLHWSGITPRKHDPQDTHNLPDLYNIGNTNIVARATRTGQGLTADELDEGAGILEEKIALHKPEAVCIVGKGVWEPIYKSKVGKKLTKTTFKYGWQDEELWLGRTVRDDGSVEWAGARTFVTTTTSGLAASTTPDEKLAIWKPLGEWVKERRENPVKQEGELAEEVS